MERFVSALGLNTSTIDNVKYLRSFVDYKDAWDSSESLRPDGLRTLIYRLSYDPDDDRFFSWRQDDQTKAGTEKDPEDPTNTALAYELFAAPEALTQGDKTTLNDRIDLIAKRSQMDRPGPAGPK